MSEQRNVKHKAVLWACLLPAIAAAAFTGLAFFNNVTVVVRWWSRFVEVGRDSSAMPDSVSGIFPLLDWSAVDLSCVSTFIPFMGCLLVLFGIVRIIRGTVVSDDGYFPFFRSFDQLNISFGLIGTLWGIIVIGYFDMETVSMSSLMSCLHTALFSTLVAVVWVFVIDHPVIRPLMRMMLEKSGLIEDSERGVSEVFDILRDRTVELGHEFTQSAGDVKALSGSVCSAAAELDKFRECGTRAGEALSVSIISAVDELVTKLTAAGDKFDERQRAYDEALSRRVNSVESVHMEAVKLVGGVADLVDGIQKAQKTFCLAAEKLSADNAALASDLLSAAKESNELRGNVAELSGKVRLQSEHMKKMEAEFSESRKTYEETISRLRAEVEREMSSRLKSESELRESLQKCAREADRANSAEKLLHKIKSAITGKNEV